MAAVLAYLNEVRDPRVFQLETQLEYSANRDSLSGAFNRRYFEEAAREEIVRASRYGHTLSLLMIDADHFKRINDAYGHAVGDATIRAIVETSGTVFRTNDLLARMGGEEFAVLLPEANAQAARQAAERLQAKLRDIDVLNDADAQQKIKAVNSNDMASYDVAANTVTLTLSIGVAQLRPNDTVDTLLQRADAALYQAKNQGRNRVIVNA